MDTIGGTGDLVRATEFIGQSSGTYNGIFDTFGSVFSRTHLCIFLRNTSLL